MPTWKELIKKAGHAFTNATLHAAMADSPAVAAASGWKQNEDGKWVQRPDTESDKLAKNLAVISAVPNAIIGRGLAISAMPEASAIERIGTVLSPSTYLAKVPAAIANTADAKLMSHIVSPAIDYGVGLITTGAGAAHTVKDVIDKNYKKALLDGAFTALGVYGGVKGLKGLTSKGMALTIDNGSNLDDLATLKRYITNSVKYRKSKLNPIVDKIKTNVADYNLAREYEALDDLYKDLGMSARGSSASPIIEEGKTKFIATPVRKMGFAEGVANNDELGHWSNGKIVLNFNKQFNTNFNDNFEGIVAHELQHAAQKNMTHARGRLTNWGGDYYVPNPSNKVYKVFDTYHKGPEKGAWIYSPDEWDAEKMNFMQQRGLFKPYKQFTKKEKQDLIKSIGREFMPSELQDQVEAATAAGNKELLRKLADEYTIKLDTILKEMSNARYKQGGIVSLKRVKK